MPKGTQQWIPVAKPWLNEKDAAAASAAILSGWVTQGPQVEAFEQEFAAFTGARHACAVSSCTAALQLALLAVGVGPGDEVITVSHSFIATANSVRACGALPVFIDVASGSWNMDPALIEKAATKRTKAILCVHQLGMPSDLPSILAAGKRLSLPVVEDAACAIGSEILMGGRWERVGKPHADVACFSFHPRKILTTGDGGMLTTGSDEKDRLFRLWRQHGMNLSDSARHRAQEVAFESYVLPGFNHRMTDIQAAIGREQLKRLPEMLKRRAALAHRYGSLLRKIPGLGIPENPAWARTNWQSYAVTLPAGLSQREVMQEMLDKGVATRRGVMCAHREPAYPKQNWSGGRGHERCDCAAGTCKRLRQSESVQDRTILLPLYHEMQETDQDRVFQALQEACAAGAVKIA